MDIKMIVTDLDGTFLRTDKSVSAYSQKIIQQCREKGIVFVIATARPVRAVKNFLPFLSYDSAIYHNGAVVRLGEKMLDGYGIPNPENIFSSSGGFSRSSCVRRDTGLSVCQFQSREHMEGYPIYIYGFYRSAGSARR